MNEQLLSELNENLKKYLESQQPKKVKVASIRERAITWVDEVIAKTNKKRYT